MGLYSMPYYTIEYFEHMAYVRDILYQNQSMIDFETVMINKRKTKRNRRK